MKKGVVVFIVYVVFCCSAFGQKPLRHFMQPPNVINNIPYGNNPQAGHYVQSKDAKIYYEVYGKGQPIVVLHGGLFGSTTEMARIIDSLANDFQVIAISTRGHGKSEIGVEPLTLEQRANDVLAVIHEATKEKVMILGFSDGGFTAYKFGSMYPDKVKKMIVIGAGVLYPGLRDFNFNFNQAMEMDTEFWAQQRALMPEPNRLEEVFKQVSNCYNQLTVGAALLGSIQCPVLLMAGDRDEGNSVQNVLNAALLIRNHQLAIIPNAGHPAFIVNFNAAWASIAPFIDEK
ncbi:alpha/beta fold hydrolase [Flavobacterium gawalongense]|uniref:Alpha/beta hydrolase n=1 Tax=Flavobacterium gawalongense TaxID=2594432 RepID=A0A553BWI8_9FLAO|nr:alpha/beta hydrolase [Flavobacterium gawalongense]TRX02000.1 alpha/beta hydrolase [Flavobacterium gawalongense]TRX06528.1 alpha/beta hydrolase [Flavobacterium gawalongense]TRX12546.1 alpha/beta hydrolase [Flavobacterium gawalongense]TRX12633.1 alpha/beta hydrolase [Flavobacterium gawalongense]TRX30578.1 alpha/beta hydrolase [Flavobacterium gawalongense]